MRKHYIFKIISCIILFLFSANHSYKSQNPYKAPLYWNPYEYHITREMAGVRIIILVNKRYLITLIG